MTEQNRKSARNEQKQQILFQENNNLKRTQTEQKQNEQIIDHSLQGRWTKQEHKMFVEALSLYGKNWRKVEEHIASRSGAQIRSHAQKFFNRLERQFNQQFNGLKSTEIQQMFENKALHNLSFGIQKESQRRPRFDSISTNFSKELISEEEQNIPEVKPTMNTLMYQIEMLQNHQFDQIDLQMQINCPILQEIAQQSQQMKQEINSSMVNYDKSDNRDSQDLMKLYQQSNSLIRTYQLISAYQNLKKENQNNYPSQYHEIEQKDQESQSYQEKSSFQESLVKQDKVDKPVQDTEVVVQDAPNNPLLRKKYSVQKIGQEESFFHFIIDKYSAYFNNQLPTLTQLADTSQKKNEKSLTIEPQQRSRRGSFVFCNEDEEENQTRYQKLKKIKKINQDEIIVNRKNTN